MNDLARERLGELMSSYGSGLCATPRMCEILLRQKCSEFPDEVQVLTQAVQTGTVQQLMKLPRGQSWDTVSGSLVTELVHSGVAEEQARWAVDSWAIALGKHPAAAPAPEPVRVNWNRLPEDQPGAGVERGLFYHPLIGAICGAIGAFIGTISQFLIMIAIVDSLTDAIPTQLKAQADAGMMILIIIVLVMALAGAVFGAFGGGFGLFIAHKLTGETRGALMWAKGGALMGAMLGAALGTIFCGIVGVVIGSMLGGWLGAFSSARASLTKRW